MPTKYVGTSELSAILGVRAETVRNWVRRGWIPCLRAGRRPLLFDVAAVEQVLRERALSKDSDSE